MEILTRGIGKMIKLMDTAYISMRGEPDTRANGRMMYSMGMVEKHGLMGQSTMAITFMAKRTGMEC
jgi:hypothetical protein